MQVYIIIACVVTLVVAAPVTWLISTTYHKKVTDKKIGSAEAKAREIIDEALKTAETKKKEMLLEAKEESIKAKKYRNMNVVFFPKKRLLTRS